jgi:transcriptional regulator with XRE-family HTH domain
MNRLGVGAVLLAERKAAGFTQAEVAARMGSHGSAISRIETERALPATDFIERYARAIARSITICFGDPPPSDEVRLERARQVFRGWLIQRNGRYYPSSADVILRLRRDADPGELYLDMLDRADRRIDDGIASYHHRWDDVDIRGAVAVAAMYHEAIDWRLVRKKVPKSLRRLDARARRRAREVVAGAD